MVPGKLSLCATPIGNLEDISFRVLRTLKEADCIAAEDTRNSIKLLNHFAIQTPMTAYHEFNKVEKARDLVTRLQRGENIALITDAGTPCISDPGEELVRQAVDAWKVYRVLPPSLRRLRSPPFPQDDLSLRLFFRQRKAIRKNEPPSCKVLPGKNEPSFFMKRRITS